MEQEFYSSKEVQKMCNITSRTLYNWRRSGKIAFKKISRKTILYPKNSILELLNVKSD